MKLHLIILHGALGCKEQFSEWANELGTHFICHQIDFAGHGARSGDDAAFSIQLFSGELRDYVQEHKLVKPNVLGYSMGGYVALFAALENENLLGDIMTLATKFDWNPESSRKEAGFLKPGLLLQKVPQLAEQLKKRHGVHWEKVVEKTAGMMVNLGEKPLLTAQNIARLRNKIKFCVGEKDKMVSISETETMFNSSAGGSLCVLPDTGHLPDTMNARLVVSEVGRFLLHSAKR